MHGAIAEQQRPEPVPSTRRGRHRSLLRRRGLQLCAVVALLAFTTRLLLVVRGAGLYGLQGYDDSVYYSGAASLVFGRLPYRDFLFLHPPGVLLVLAPFAQLGRITSDPTGLAVARVAFMAIGALNAVLVTRLAARAGLAAAAVAGLLYATWLPSMLAERTTLLEPVMTLAVLTGLLLLDPLRGEPSRRRQLLAGCALGCAVCVKLWGAAPLVVVVLALVLARRGHAAVRVVAGAVAAGAVVCGPFLAGAGTSMVRMVVLDQAGRPRMRGSVLYRLADLTSVQRHVGRGHDVTVIALTVAACCLLVAIAVLAAREQRARLWVALLLAHVGVLLLSPTYYAHYASFAGVPLALSTGAATAALVRGRSARGRPAQGRALAAVLVPVALLGAHSASARFGIPYPAARLAAGVPARGCVVADDNTALIELDVLTRDLRAGCHLEPDVTGKVYELGARRPRSQRGMTREEDREWQAVAFRYLTTGDATAMVWGGGNGFTPRTRASLLSLPLLAGEGRFVVLGR